METSSNTLPINVAAKAIALVAALCTTLFITASTVVVFTSSALGA